MGKKITIKEACKAICEHFDLVHSDKEKITIEPHTLSTILRGRGVCADARTINRLCDELRYNEIIFYDNDGGNFTMQISVEKTLDNLRYSFPSETQGGAHTLTHTSYRRGDDE